MKLGTGRFDLILGSDLAQKSSLLSNSGSSKIRSKIERIDSFSYSHHKFNHYRHIFPYCLLASRVKEVFNFLDLLLGKVGC